MNLAVNARDAMPAGGELTIETANVELGDAMPRHLGRRAPGRTSCWRSATPAPAWTRRRSARIFEPFFTTKERGKGTGLGLSTVFGIVQAERGRHRRSRASRARGTTFAIYFPLVDASTSVSPAPSGRSDDTSRDRNNPPRRRRRIRCGRSQAVSYEGRATRSSRQKTRSRRSASTKRRRKPFTCCLTDVVMPQMSGTELARRITGARNGTRVLCMSGYTDDTVVRHGVVESGVAFLQKPITPESLSAKVREVLEDPRNEPQQAPA